MELQYRRLLPSTAIDGTQIKTCCGDSESCIVRCYDLCFVHCPRKLPSPPPPPPPPPPLIHMHIEHKAKKILILTLTIFVTAFLLASCYFLYTKFFSGSSRTRRRNQQDDDVDQRTEIQQEFLDEDHEPVLDHPIWYIRTIGLQPSVISSITVCKYKRGDGLIGSTDCSICLSEFEEDETLRLLPKCSHAFHIPCIDTWLRSHTNCPICRAPIVANAARVTSPSEPNPDSASSGEEVVVEVAEQERPERTADREIEGGDHSVLEDVDELEHDNRRKISEVVIEDENGIQPLRRSVSLDSLSAFKIGQVLSNLPTQESHQNCESCIVEASEGNMGIVAKRGAANQSVLSFMVSSSVGRSFQSLQIGPSSIKRSFSCSGKIFVSRHQTSP